MYLVTRTKPNTNKEYRQTVSLPPIWTHDRQHAAQFSLISASEIVDRYRQEKSSYRYFYEHANPQVTRQETAQQFPGRHRQAD